MQSFRVNRLTWPFVALTTIARRPSHSPSTSIWMVSRPTILASRHVSPKTGMDGNHVDSRRVSLARGMGHRFLTQRHKRRVFKRAPFTWSHAVNAQDLVQVVRL